MAAALDDGGLDIIRRGALFSRIRCIGGLFTRVVVVRGLVVVCGSLGARTEALCVPALGFALGRQGDVAVRVGVGGAVAAGGGPGWRCDGGGLGFVGGDVEQGVVSIGIRLL